MPSLILVRGLPGSGKSTIAKSIVGHVHVEADMFHVDVDGVYRWKQEHANQAHSWCQNLTRILLESGQNVVVSNTFTQKWELAPYRQIAKDLDANLFLVEATGNFGTLHSVPSEHVERMRRRWEHIEPGHL